MAAGSRIGAVIVAAGSGERLGAGIPKALVELAGRPLVRWAADALAAAGLPPPVVVHPAGQRDVFAMALDGVTLAALVAGGETRTDSVRAGLAALAADADPVVVHDAARPLVPVDTIERVVSAVTGDVLAAAPAIELADTLKRVDGDEVVETVDRAALRAVQTPQVFRRAALTVLADGSDATDELGLVERARSQGRLDGRIVVVQGSPRSHKATTPEDLALLEAFVASDAKG